jgi:hypothetical protein
MLCAPIKLPVRYCFTTATIAVDTLVTAATPTSCAGITQAGASSWRKYCSFAVLAVLLLEGVL